MNCIFWFVFYCNLWIASIDLHSECKKVQRMSNLILMIKFVNGNEAEET